MFSPYGMMGMGMGMGMPMPMMMPTPGVMPGMPGMGMINAMPGRFGRDMLGRDFAGPGGVGASQPYRPPDPSALPPMPFGLPFIARPGQEGFDAYGRMLPPDLPEGWDGWGRPIVAATSQPGGMPAPPNIAPQGGAPGLNPDQATAMGAGGPGAYNQPTATRDMPMTSTPGSSSQSTSRSGTGTGTNRPEQPPCFDRPPAPQDSYFRYSDFDAFSLNANALNHSWELHLPRELVSHDVSEQDWAKFIDDLAKECISKVTHNWGAADTNRLGRGPKPILSDGVHSLLASWAVAFFQPRGIKVYAAKDGRRVIPAPLDPVASRRGFSRADEWSDDDDANGGSYSSDTLDDEEEEDYIEEEASARRNDMYLPRRERALRRKERDRQRRREIRRKRERRSNKKNGDVHGDWEIHFICTTPTIWSPGARPRTYGEPAMRLRR